MGKVVSTSLATGQAPTTRREHHRAQPRLVTAASGILAAGGSALANASTPTNAPAATRYYSATNGPQGGPGQGRASNDTPVTGSELTSVKAKDPAATVTSARKDPDGSYDVFGTRSGSPVMLEVSKDLKTITVNIHGPSNGPGAAPSIGQVGLRAARVRPSRSGGGRT